jgi:hypothetical protein
MTSFAKYCATRWKNCAAMEVREGREGRRARPSVVVGGEGGSSRQPRSCPPAAADPHHNAKTDDSENHNQTQLLGTHSCAHLPWA